MQHNERVPELRLRRRLPLVPRVHGHDVRGMRG
jgi:hypothetical protein